MSKSKRTSNKPNEDERIAEILRNYSQSRPLQDQFTTKIVELLKVLLHVRNVDIHVIESRTKDVESLGEKIRRASKKYADPLKEITDLSGIRIIAYYEKDVDSISQLIEEEFEIDRDNSVNKRSVMKPEEFGYQSVHSVVSLSSTRASLLEWRHLSKLKAEIQVRTVLQHAWAAISHKLQYKREEDVPRALRRRLFRLSALLELADEDFMRLRDDTISLTQTIERRLAEGETNLEINVLTVDEFLRTSESVAIIVEHAKKAKFSFKEYEAEGEDEKTRSDLVSTCNHVGLKLISDLKNSIDDSVDWSESYLVDQYKIDGAFWEVSPAFVCILILVKAFRETIDVPHLRELGWSKYIAHHVIEVADKKIQDSL